MSIPCCCVSSKIFFLFCLQHSFFCLATLSFYFFACFLIQYFLLACCLSTPCCCTRIVLQFYFLPCSTFPRRSSFSSFAYNVVSFVSLHFRLLLCLLLDTILSACLLHVDSLFLHSDRPSVLSFFTLFHVSSMINLFLFGLQRSFFCLATLSFYFFASFLIQNVLLACCVSIPCSALGSSCLFPGFYLVPRFLGDPLLPINRRNSTAVEFYATFTLLSTLMSQR